MSNHVRYTLCIRSAGDPGDGDTKRRPFFAAHFASVVQVVSQLLSTQGIKQDKMMSKSMDWIWGKILTGNHGIFTIKLIGVSG